MSLPGQGARVLAPWQAEDLALSRSTWNPALREAHPLVVLPAPRPLPSGLPPPGAPGLRPPGLAPLPHTGVSGPSASCFLHICLRCLDFRDPFLCASVPVFWGAHLCASAPVFWGSPLCLSPHILGTISLPQSPILWGSSCLRARLCSRLLAVLPSPCCLRSAWQPRTPQDSPPATSTSGLWGLTSCLAPPHGLHPCPLEPFLVARPFTVGEGGVYGHWGSLRGCLVENRDTWPAPSEECAPGFAVVSRMDGVRPRPHEGFLTDACSQVPSSATPLTGGWRRSSCSVAPEPQPATQRGPGAHEVGMVLALQTPSKPRLHPLLQPFPLVTNPRICPGCPHLAFLYLLLAPDSNFDLDDTLWHQMLRQFPL